MGDPCLTSVRLHCPCRVPLQAAKRAALARGDQVVLVESDWRWWSLSSVFVQQNPYKVSVRRQSRMHWEVCKPAGTGV